MAKEKRKYTTITIPLPLFEKLTRVIRGTGFSSVSDYVTYVLRELVVELEESKGKGSDKSDVIRKLKELGYV
ncbi:MAG: CopG family transcriptional regulator [Candidatus Micrarchaeia archaeon]